MDKELIKELEETKATLLADGYKSWSYVIMSIDKAINFLTTGNKDQQRIYIGSNGTYLEEVGNEIKVVQKNGDQMYLKSGTGN